MTDIGIIGIGTYFPEKIEVAADLVDVTGIPENILRDKMGIRQRHIAGETDTISHMASEAGKRAIDNAGIDPSQIKMVISHGSEYKDHVVWNAAGKIAHNVGADNAFAFETYALCAGAPITLKVAQGMMLADPSLDYVLLAAASRENDLVSPGNPRARFMFNFGAGGGAMVLQRDAGKNRVLGSAAYTDGALSETVILTTEPDAIGDGQREYGDLVGRLDVSDPEFMSTRLGEKSMPMFKQVITEAVEKSDHTVEDIAFMGIVHMKKSFYLKILEEFNLTEDQSVYLEDYGHIQSVDQSLALQLGVQQGKVKPGDLVVLVGAGTGYTWSAVAVKWG